MRLRDMFQKPARQSDKRGPNASFYIPIKEELEALLVDPDEEVCLEFIWLKIYGTTVIKCPSCGRLSVYRHAKSGTASSNHYRCSWPDDRHIINPLTDTVFFKSHLPLPLWFKAIQLIEYDKQVPATVIADELQVSFQTAQRLKELLLAALDIHIVG